MKRKKVKRSRGQRFGQRMIEELEGIKDRIDRIEKRSRKAKRPTRRAKSLADELFGSEEE